MDYNIGDEITIEDNKEYIIIDLFEMNKTKYIYLLNKENKKEIHLLKIENNTLFDIKDDNEFEKVLNELINRSKDKIVETLKDE